MKQRFFLIALLPLLAGCGFHPLYGDAKLQPQLASIYVEPVPERDGYELRNTLINLLASNGESGGKTYHLKLLLNETNQGVALQNDATITRYNDTLTVSYVLIDAKGTEVTRGTQSSLASYNTVSSPYATLAGQQDADKRAAQEIAERIRLDLGVFFPPPGRAMIVAPRDADRFAAAPPKTLRVALLFGPDSGLVRERAEKLMKSVVPDISDAFNVADLSEAVLDADPARLADEAAAISMMGGRRVVRVRGAGNDLTSLFESFLEDPPGDALVVVEAGDLSKGTGLRKLFEDDDSAAAIACYADTARGLEDVVRDSLRAAGLSIAPDALADAVSRLGSDRGVSRQELEKLALYAQGQKSVSLDDVRAVMGDEAGARTEEASDAAGSGDFARLDLALERLWTAEMSAIAVIRGAMGHFQRLALVRENMARGENLDSAMRKLRPPIHFLRQDSFKAQAQRWNSEKLYDALDMLLEAETLTKTTGVPNEAVCGRTLMNIAAMAKGRM